MSTIFSILATTTTVATTSTTTTQPYQSTQTFTQVSSASTNIFPKPTISYSKTTSNRNIPTKASKSNKTKSKQLKFVYHDKSNSSDVDIMRFISTKPPTSENVNFNLSQGVLSTPLPRTSQAISHSDTGVGLNGITLTSTPSFGLINQVLSTTPETAPLYSTARVPTSAKTTATTSTATTVSFLSADSLSTTTALPKSPYLYGHFQPIENATAQYPQGYPLQPPSLVSTSIYSDQPHITYPQQGTYSTETPSQSMNLNAPGVQNISQTTFNTNGQSTETVYTTVMTTPQNQSVNWLETSAGNIPENTITQSSRIETTSTPAGKYGGNNLATVVPPYTSVRNTEAKTVLSIYSTDNEIHSNDTLNQEVDLRTSTERPNEESVSNGAEKNLAGTAIKATAGINSNQTNDQAGNFNTSLPNVVSAEANTSAPYQVRGPETTPQPFYQFDTPSSTPTVPPTTSRTEKTLKQETVVSTNAYAQRFTEPYLYGNASNLYYYYYRYLRQNTTNVGISSSASVSAKGNSTSSMKSKSASTKMSKPTSTITKTTSPTHKVSSSATKSSYYPATGIAVGEINNGTLKTVPQNYYTATNPSQKPAQHYATKAKAATVSQLPTVTKILKEISTTYPKYQAQYEDTESSEDFETLPEYSEKKPVTERMVDTSPKLSIVTAMKEITNTYPYDQKNYATPLPTQSTTTITDASTPTTSTKNTSQTFEYKVYTFGPKLSETLKVTAAPYITGKQTNIHSELQYTTNKATTSTTESNAEAETLSHDAVLSQGSPTSSGGNQNYDRLPVWWSTQSTADITTEKPWKTPQPYNFETTTAETEVATEAEEETSGDDTFIIEPTTPVSPVIMPTLTTKEVAPLQNQVTKAVAFTPDITTTTTTTATTSRTIKPPQFSTPVYDESNVNFNPKLGQNNIWLNTQTEGTTTTTTTTSTTEMPPAISTTEETRATAADGYMAKVVQPQTESRFSLAEMTNATSTPVTQELSFPGSEETQSTAGAYLVETTASTTLAMPDVAANSIFYQFTPNLTSAADNITVATTTQQPITTPTSLQIENATPQVKTSSVPQTTTQIPTTSNYLSLTAAGTLLAIPTPLLPVTSSSSTVLSTESTAPTTMAVADNMELFSTTAAPFSEEGTTISTVSTLEYTNTKPITTKKIKFESSSSPVAGFTSSSVSTGIKADVTTLMDLSK